MAHTRLGPTTCRFCGHDLLTDHELIKAANTPDGPVPCRRCDTGTCDRPKLEKTP